MELSLCMIVKNEEANLSKCLESVQGVVDEIVIVDTGSTDATKEIARRYTDKVYDYQWEDDFSKARNVSMDYATKPYVLWLDADDVLERSEREKLLAFKKQLDGKIDAVMMPYHYAHNPDGTPSMVFDRERIVRREAGFRFAGVVHEAMAVGGHVTHVDIAITHTGNHGAQSTKRNLAIYELWRERGGDFAPRDRYYYARELMANGFVERAEQVFAEFLAGDGWIENRIDAFLQRGRCLVQLGKTQQARECYMQALDLGVPRAEVLCALGDTLFKEGAWEAAAFWYRAAMQAEKPEASSGFIVQDAYGYIPAMQLCVCYDHLGRTQEAAEMNERALLYHPGDQAALKNREYFENLRKKQEKTGV